MEHQQKYDAKITGNGKQEDETLMGDYEDIEQGRLSAHYNNKERIIKQYHHMSSLSPHQMDSLSALCDTYLPSLHHDVVSAGDDSVIKFFQTSASMAETPHYVRVSIKLLLSFGHANGFLFLFF